MAGALAASCQAPASTRAAGLGSSSGPSHEARGKLETNRPPYPPLDDVGALVDLVDRDHHRAFCTGTLLGPTWVLTAAHCIAGREVGNVAFSLDFSALGDGRWQTKPQGYLVKSFHVHPNYFHRSDVPSHTLHDLALLELIRPVPARQAGIRLDDGTTPLLGREAIHVGFGLSDLTDPESHGARRFATVSLEEVGLNTLSQTTQGSMFCQGDSGGPLFVAEAGSLLLVGVTSQITLNPTAHLTCSGTVSHARVALDLEWLRGEAPALLGSSRAPALGLVFDAGATSPRQGAQRSGRRLACAQAYTCLAQCNSVGGACWTDCLASTEEDALSQLRRLHDCMRSSCEHRSEEAFGDCTLQRCRPQIDTCGLDERMLSP